MVHHHYHLLFIPHLPLYHLHFLILQIFPFFLFFFASCLLFRATHVAVRPVTSLAGCPWQL
jgi:hypothetical protein